MNPALSSTKHTNIRKCGVKVLHVTTHMNMGGIANYILSLATAIKRKGVDSVVASSGGDMEGELSRCGIAHIPLEIRTKFEFSPKVIRAVFRIAEIIDREGIKIVHAHTRVSQVAGWFASRIAKVPYVTTCHGFFKRRIGRRLFDFWGEKVVAISGPVRMSLVKDFGVKPERVELIHSGVDIDKFSKEYSAQEVSDIRKKLGLDAAHIIGTMGRLSPVKGHMFFIDALKRVLAKGYNVKGVIIGSGPEEDRLKELARKYGIEDSVCFIESVTDTRIYLAAMDIFVFPSIKEGLGLSLLEAMASGKPCLASDIGGISDIITNGENGLLFKVGDVKALGDSLTRLLDDEGLRRRLGYSAKALVGKRFSLDMMADKMVELYNAVS